MQGIFIPIEILQDESLSLQEKLILSLVKNMPQGLYMTNQSIGNLLNLSKGRISHIISSLVSKGYCDINLVYKANSCQVDKRVLTLSKALQMAKNAIKTVSNKAKELKQEYTITKQQVGTQQVEQVTFGDAQYTKKSNTNTFTNQSHKSYTKPVKKNKFLDMYSHDWDFDELERLEQEYIDRKIEEINKNKNQTMRRDVL